MSKPQGCEECRRLWHALDRIASLNRTELPADIDPFARAVCIAQDAIGPQPEPTEEPAE